jgi:hypothetical protein
MRKRPCVSKTRQRFNKYTLPAKANKMNCASFDDKELAFVKSTTSGAIIKFRWKDMSSL